MKTMLVTTEESNHNSGPRVRKFGKVSLGGDDVRVDWSSREVVVVELKR
jgi:hypothetical protein